MEDFETEDRRQQGSSGEEIGAGQKNQGPANTFRPSANTSATSAPPRFDSANDDIDWGRVDLVLEVESRRLAVDARAGAVDSEKEIENLGFDNWDCISTIWLDF